MEVKVELMQKEMEHMRRNMKTGTASDISSNAKEKYKKKKIPQALRMKVWENSMGYKGQCKCEVCDRPVFVDDFHCSHIIAEVNGGLTVVDNLVILCRPCNLSCGAKDLEEFKKCIISKRIVEEKNGISLIVKNMDYSNDFINDNHIYILAKNSKYVMIYNGEQWKLVDKDKIVGNTHQVICIEK
jgi:5-methylcytosine-specific restriction endonuclease McrA